MRYFSTADLTTIGFAADEAERIAPLLPGLTAKALRHATRHAWYVQDDSGPAAVVLYATRRVPADVARRLARSGRSVLELIGILDAFVDYGRLGYWATAMTDVVLEWAEDQRIASDRVTAYIRAGVSREEAAAFEADQSTRPSSGQLDVLAALRSSDTARD